MNETFFWIHSIKHIDNCRRCLILLIVPQDFLFEDNCNSSKNLSSVIHILSPKRHLTFIKNIRVIFLEDKQELIKRISLNTWILIVVFNEILIPWDFFFEDNCNSSKNPSSEIHDYLPKINLFKANKLTFSHAWKTWEERTLNWHAWTVHKIKC